MPPPPALKASGSKPPTSASKQFVRYWLPVILYAVLILSLSSIPLRIRIVPFRYYDKVFHLIEYGIYAYLWYRAIRFSATPSSSTWAGILTFSICSAFGALDELYQAYTPYRISDIYDVAADASGSFVVVSLVMLKEFFMKRC